MEQRTGIGSPAFPQAVERISAAKSKLSVRSLLAPASPSSVFCVASEIAVHEDKPFSFVWRNCRRAGGSPRARRRQRERQRPAIALSMRNSRSCVDRGDHVAARAEVCRLEGLKAGVCNRPASLDTDKQKKSRTCARRPAWTQAAVAASHVKGG